MYDISIQKNNTHLLHDEKALQESLIIMVDNINQILDASNPSVMLYGSLVYEDFRFGWSDIDFLCLTEVEITAKQADELLELRQRLNEKYNNPYFRLFEGVFISRLALNDKTHGNIVYWGTSGQKIKQEFQLDPFAKIEIIEHGRLLCGDDFRSQISYPSKNELIAAIKNHYEAIVKYGSRPDESLYSAGWILDTARCIYTLKNQKIISKTMAGEWAIENNQCPNPNIMRKVLKIRNNPLLYKHDEKTLAWLGTLNKYIIEFASNLEVELHEEQIL